MESGTREHLQNAAQGAKARANEQKDSAASSLGGFAGALRKAAKDSAAHSAMRFTSPPSESFAAALAAGFLASRFLKAGAGDGHDRPQEAMPQNFPPPGAGGVSATERADISSTTPF